MFIYSVKYQFYPQEHKNIYTNAEAAPIPGQCAHDPSHLKELEMGTMTLKPDFQTLDLLGANH